MKDRALERHQRLLEKRIEILNVIKPICEAFGIQSYDYEIENNRERLVVNGTRIGCSCNSVDDVIDELVGYIFVKRFRDRWLGHFKIQTFNKIKEYWEK